MNECAIPLGVTAIACAIANEIETEDELALLAAVFVQIGDTLATIAVERAKLKT